MSQTNAPVTPRKSPGPVNKVYVDSLDRSQKVVNAALDPLYNATILDGVQITPQFLATLNADIGIARGFLSSATSGRGVRKTSTAAQNLAKDQLAQALQGIQTRAYQKFHVSDPDRLKSTYFGGTNLFKASDALTEQIVNSYFQALQTDVLPKVDAARIQNLQTLFATWNSARGVQDTSGGAAITSLTQFKTLLGTIEEHTRTIQFAADDDFPHRDPENKVAREAFQIPSNDTFRA